MIASDGVDRISAVIAWLCGAEVMAPRRLALTQGQSLSIVGMTTRIGVRHFTVHHDGVTIPVSRGGRGRPLVLCPGLNSTQADLHELAELLRRDHDVVTFDLRGH